MDESSALGTYSLANVNRLWRLVLAHLGSSRAQLALAHMCWLAGNEKQAAIAWAERAAGRDDPDAHLFLGGLYLERDGPGDRTRTFESYATSAKAGKPAGMQALAWCFEQGVGTPVSLLDALHWYRRAADGGRVDSQMAVSRMLLKGTAGVRDLTEARRYAALAKANGAVEADALLETLSRMQ